MLARLQYILLQPTDSLQHRVYQAHVYQAQAQMYKVYQVYQVQLESSTSGDWACETYKILQMLKIELSNQDIKDMKASQFEALIRNKTEIVFFFSYIFEKQIKGQKGREITCTKVQMADYLLPDTLVFETFLKSGKLHCKLTFNRK